MRKILIIHNPYSGNQKNSENIKNKLACIAKEHGYDITFKKTKKRNDATRIISKCRHYDLVVSMGGDGTFNEIVAGNLKRKIPLKLSHLSVGTTNDLKSSFGFTGDIISDFINLLNGKDVSYDVLSVNGTPFTYSAGFGKFLNIPYETTKEEKTKLGYLAYVKNGVIDYFKNYMKMYNIEYEVEGKKRTIETPLVLISNSNRIAGYKIYNNVKLNDDKFEVLIAKTTAVIPLAIGLVKVKLNLSNKSFKIIRTNHIKIITKDKINSWCIDGEKLNTNTTEYDVKVLKKMSCRVALKTKDYL